MPLYRMMPQRPSSLATCKTICVCLNIGNTYNILFGGHDIEIRGEMLACFKAKCLKGNSQSVMNVKRFDPYFEIFVPHVIILALKWVGF